MTTFEHALLAIHGCLATGIERRCGWKIVAVAAVAAIAPDWDGLSLAFGATWFDRAHRLWGHNLFAAAAVGLLIGLLDYRFDVIGKPVRWAFGKISVDVAELKWRNEEGASVGAWMVVGLLAAISHPLVDLVFSGGVGLSHWELQLGWPLSRKGWVYPLVPWGDVGVSVVLFAGLLAMLRWPGRVRLIAQLTLASGLLYVVVRGSIAA